MCISCWTQKNILHACQKKLYLSHDCLAYLCVFPSSGKIKIWRWSVEAQRFGLANF